MEIDLSDSSINFKIINEFIDTATQLIIENENPNLNTLINTTIDKFKKFKNYKDIENKIIYYTNLIIKLHNKQKTDADCNTYFNHYKFLIKELFYKINNDININSILIIDNYYELLINILIVRKELYQFTYTEQNNYFINYLNFEHKYIKYSFRFLKFKTNIYLWHMTIYNIITNTTKFKIINLNKLIRIIYNLIYLNNNKLIITINFNYPIHNYSTFIKYY